MIAKHPPHYYIDGLKRYIRGANLVPKALTLVRRFKKKLFLLNKFFYRKRNIRLNRQLNYYQV